MAMFHAFKLILLSYYVAPASKHLSMAKGLIQCGVKLFILCVHLIVLLGHHFE